MTTKRRAPEKMVQHAVKRALKTLGFHVTDLSQPRASMITAGTPDLYATSKRFRLALWVEVKAPKGKLSLAQQAWQEQARAAGADVITVWGLDDLLRELRARSVPIT